MSQHQKHSTMVRVALFGLLALACFQAQAVTPGLGYPSKPAQTGSANATANPAQLDAAEAEQPVPSPQCLSFFGNLIRKAGKGR